MFKFDYSLQLLLPCKRDRAFRVRLFLLLDPLGFHFIVEVVDWHRIAGAEDGDGQAEEALNAHLTDDEWVM